MEESAKSKAGAIGSRVGAAAVGAVLTSTLGPEGAAATSEALAQAGEMAVGWLQGRAAGRVRKTLEETSEQVASRRAAGESVRPDFADAKNESAAALFESVVVAAADDADDRKCKVLANVYASLAFDPAPTLDDALLYVRRIREASWRQLVALSYLADPDRAEERELAASAGNEGGVRARASMAAEMIELAEALGLVGVAQEGGSTAAPAATLGGGGFITASLAKWTPTELGDAIVRLGRLRESVGKAELDSVAHSLAEAV
jgi:hypothetical protein